MDNGDLAYRVLDTLYEIPRIQKIRTEHKGGPYHDQELPVGSFDSLLRFVKRSSPVTKVLHSPSGVLLK